MNITTISGDSTYGNTITITSTAKAHRCKNGEVIIIDTLENGEVIHYTESGDQPIKGLPDNY